MSRSSRLLQKHTPLNPLLKCQCSRRLQQQNHNLLNPLPKLHNQNHPQNQRRSCAGRRGGDL